MDSVREIPVGDIGLRGQLRRVRESSRRRAVRPGTGDLVGKCSCAAEGQRQPQVAPEVGRASDEGLEDCREEEACS
ncbi:unnamed protein product [Linum tenue]|uniref:Uncharacterized protein n=2 Tax=Linum tenue TaxID=586396 RepID=A0AAV0LL93_9ROSI|nr:unnamed protein product [Linum tenue]CAI0558759.1 unnamed protein product [Linum tenue]